MVVITTKKVAMCRGMTLNGCNLCDYICIKKRCVKMFVFVCDERRIPAYAESGCFVVLIRAEASSLWGCKQYPDPWVV